MLPALLLLATTAWGAVVSEADSLRRVDTTALYQPFVNEVLYMGVGCAAGAAAGAMIGTMPVVTLYGGVVTPYTAPQGALYGCMAGSMIGTVGAKTYNASATYWKYFKKVD